MLIAHCFVQVYHDLQRQTLLRSADTLLLSLASRQDLSVLLHPARRAISRSPVRDLLYFLDQPFSSVLILLPITPRLDHPNVPYPQP